jgi:membrane fusion protein (multidrug efflux system)
MAQEATQAASNAATVTAVTNGNGAMQARRRKLVIAILAVFLLGGAAYGAYWALVSRYLQSTDDAYVSGNIVQITPQIAGTVVGIRIDDTQFVQAGQTLVELDQADAKVALDRAEAELAKTVREVRNLFATTAQLRASVDLHQSDLARAEEDFTRRERLGASGAVSGEELQHARDTVRSAQASLAAAQQQLEANRARTDRTTVEDHPDVKAGAARVRDAYLTYARTVLPAPVNGFVAKRSVQLGQRVGPGTPLMAVIPLDAVWVDANFKEAQLAGMRIGQPVALKADLYGGKVEYHGRIAGFGAGTGSAFAVLPAQNATGNWIKIVQRIPVRIALDPKELSEHPLQIGLSMQVEVDTRESGGERLPQTAQAPQDYTTSVFRTLEDQANQRVKSIIAANSVSVGGATQARGPAGSDSAATLARADRAKPVATAHAGAF